MGKGKIGEKSGEAEIERGESKKYGNFTNEKKTSQKLLFKLQQ